jgi:hypothetical protein
MTYKLHAQPVAGESYVRCNQVIIENPAASPPTILFSRERVIGVDGGEVIRQPLQPVPLAFDPLGEIPLVDMETGEPTGQIIRQVEVLRPRSTPRSSPSSDPPRTARTPQRR